MACNIYDLHPGIKTNISNTEYIESMQIPSALHRFYNSFHTNYQSNFQLDTFGGLLILPDLVK